MGYNPFNDEYNKLKKIIADLNTNKRLLSVELKWFDGVDIQKLTATLDDKISLVKIYESRIELVKQEINKLNDDIQNSKKQTKSLLNPFNWFDKDQREIREHLNGLKSNLRERVTGKSTAYGLKRKVTKAITQTRLSIEKYYGFNRENIITKIDGLNSELNSLENDFKKIKASKRNADDILHPILTQKNKYENEINEAKNKIDIARSFSQKLDGAENSYERAMVHKDCEASLGYGRPATVIREQESLIKRLQRNLDKVTTRATRTKDRLSRNILKLIIDGNNMCYEGGDRFVGLQPIILASSELAKQYNIIIVFDSAIRSQLKANNKTIKSNFDSIIDVHIVATSQLADETILDLASNEPQCYILSNDRFGEYKDKEAVTAERLIRHEIVDNTIIIHDLNIKLKYILS